MKLLLFDVDHTLIQTGGAGVRALTRAFAETLGIENAIDGLLLSGRTDPSIIREVFELNPRVMATGVQIETILTAYVSFLRQEVGTSPSYQVLPGIPSILSELRQRSDVLLGLATGNIELGARIKLERGDLNQYFPFGGFGSDYEDRADLVRHAAEMAAAHSTVSISPSDVFVIGDTPRDVHAGQAAGFCTIGVATGKYSQEELQAAGATMVMADFERDRDQFLLTTRMV